MAIFSQLNKIRFTSIGIIGIIGVCLCLSMLLGSSLPDRETISPIDNTLTIYTNMDEGPFNTYLSLFTSKHPDVEVNAVRRSTGEITALLLAERDDPQADVVWGLAATSLKFLADQGYFQPYAPKGVEQLDPKYMDSAKPPVWVGQRAWIASLCFNTVEAEKLKLPKPVTWQDLTRPEFKGHVVMPNPNSSGTGFLDVSAWLQLWGEDKGWKFMDGLHQNIAQYTHSGSKPCKMAAAGEIPVGISFAYRGAQEKTKGAPIDVIAPSEGLGWDLEAFAIHKGTKKLDAAKKLADWASSKDAMMLYGKNFAITAQPGVAAPLANVPKDYEQRLVKLDFNYAAEQRERILTEWTRRYDGKTEQKK